VTAGRRTGGGTLGTGFWRGRRLANAPESDPSSQLADASANRPALVASVAPPGKSHQPTPERRTDDAHTVAPARAPARQDEVAKIEAAERERPRLEREGVAHGQLLACSEVAADRTRLRGLYKIYVPIVGGPPSARPFAFVFSVAERDGHIYLRLVAFGERHPPQGTRSVHERAHKRLHGRYPDQ
jgi:hypothetical protein